LTIRDFASCGKLKNCLVCIITVREHIRVASAVTSYRFEEVLDRPLGHAMIDNLHEPMVSETVDKSVAELNTLQLRPAKELGEVKCWKLHLFLADKSIPIEEFKPL